MMRHEPEYLDDAGLQQLVKNERLVIGVHGGYVVYSSPGERGHPLIHPPPHFIGESWQRRIFRDRRGS